jgi:hypothetical protein
MRKNTMSRWLPSIALIFLAILGVWGIQQMTSKTQPVVSFPAVDTQGIKNGASTMLEQGKSIGGELKDTLGSRASELGEKTQQIGANAMDKAADLKNSAAAPVAAAGDKAADLAQKGMDLLKGQGNAAQRAALQPNLGSAWNVSPIANSSNTFKAINTTNKQELTATVTQEGSLKRTVLTDASGKTVSSFEAPVQ